MLIHIAKELLDYVVDPTRSPSSVQRPSLGVPDRHLFAYKKVNDGLGAIVLQRASFEVS